MQEESGRQKRSPENHINGNAIFWQKMSRHTKTFILFFYPPDKRHRDLDNMLASVKYGLDGIAEAWGINDRVFNRILIELGKPIKNGMVCIYELKN
jgi:hypothetical protein